MKVDKQEFLNALQRVTPGLAAREIVEQSSCFVFLNGHVVTYNEEVACRFPFDAGFEGAVTGKKLQEILGKLKENYVTVTVGEGELLLKPTTDKGKGTGRSCGITMESDVTLPVDTVEKVSKWRKLPDGFLEAIEISRQCTVKEHDSFFLTCINIAPEYIEACDNFQVVRYDIKTGLKRSTIVKADSVKAIVELEMTKFSITKGWMHFKNVDGLELSCRRYDEEYPSLDKFHDDDKGNKVTLPVTLKDAIDKASIFSEDNPDGDNVSVTINKNRIEIAGRGSSGWYREKKKSNYTGQEISFEMPPKLLAEITQREGFRECKMNERWLSVDVGNWHYRTSLKDTE